MRKLVDSASFVASKGNITPKEVVDLLSVIKNELQEVLGRSDQNESAPPPSNNVSDKINDPDEELIHNLHLQQQYQDQRRIFNLLDKKHFLPRGLTLEGGIPILEIENNRSMLEDWKSASEVLQKNREIIKEKSAQGFRRLLLVPFGIKLTDLVETFKHPPASG